MIAFCHLLNDASGSPVVLREAINALTCEGEDAVLFVGSHGRGVLERAEIPIRRYWYRRSRFRLLTVITYTISQILLYRALTKARLDSDAVIYVNTLLPFGAAVWGRRHGRKVIIHIHEVSISPLLLQRFLVAIVEKTADRVIYVSHDNRERLPARNVLATVVPNPIAPRIAKLGSATLYAPRRTGRFVALMLSSPRDFKGVPEFVNLARQFSDRHDVQFTLVLNGDRVELEHYLCLKRLPSNIEVHPRTEAPEDFYAKADVLLNLSRIDQWIETFGLTIIEGMAFGLPVIVPPVGGPAEIVVDGQEGTFVDSRDLFALEKKIRYFADDPERVMLMSHAARRRASDFTFEKFSVALREQMMQLSGSMGTQK